MKAKYPVLIICIAIIAAAAYFMISSGTDTQSTLVEESEQDLSADSTETSIFSINGRVTDGVSHKSLTATVSLASSHQNTQTITCDDDGNYQFDINVDEVDSYDLTASLTGYVPRGKNDISHLVSLDTQNNVNDVVQDIELWPESRMIGRVTYEDSGIAANIKLTYQIDASGAENYDFKSLTTNDNGDFIFDMAYAGTSKLVISADGFPDLTLSDIVLEPGKTEDLGDIPLSHGLTLFGGIYDIRTREPLPNAKVELIRDDEVIFETQADELGAYQFPAFLASEIRVKTSSDNYKINDINLTTGSKTELKYDIYLTPIEGISLTVNNITGREPILSTVSITDIESDRLVYQKELKNGTYDMPELTAGPYLFTAVSADGETSTSMRVMSGNAVTLTLKPYGKLNVKFNLSPSDTPFVEGKYQYTYDSDDGQNEIKGWFKTTSDSFSVENLKPGTYTFEGEAKDSKNEKRKKYKSKPVHLSMGDTEFVNLMPALPTEVVMCDFPTNADPSEMEDAIADCYDKANEALDMFNAYLETDSFSDDINKDMENYIATAGDMVQKFVPAYTDIISRTSDPELKVACSFKLGSAFEKISEFMQSAPIPPELSPESIPQYRQLVFNYAAQFDNKAAQFYYNSITQGSEFSINNEYVKKATEHLAAIKSRYETAQAVTTQPGK